MRLMELSGWRGANLEGHVFLSVLLIMQNLQKNVAEGDMKPKTSCAANVSARTVECCMKNVYVILQCNCPSLM